MSACTRACSPQRSRSSSRICAASATSPTSARPRRTGRSSTSSSTTRPIAMSAAIRAALAEFERTGRISWTTDLADIPAEYGVSNVYGDVGQLFATTLISEPPSAPA